MLESLIEEYAREGSSINSCSRKFGISRHRVRVMLEGAGVELKDQGRAYRESISRRPRSRLKEPLPVEEIVAEYRKFGSTIPSCSRKFGVSDYHIKKCLTEAGVELKSQRQASEEANALRERTDMPSREELSEAYSILSNMDLARKYRTNGNTIRAWMDFYGIERVPHGERVSRARRANYASRIEELPDPTETYEQTGYNKTETARILDLTRNEIDALFEKYEIETRLPQCSRAELELFDFLKEIDPDGDWARDSGKIISPFHLDMYSSVRRLAVEYGGLRWHCDDATHDPDKPNAHRGEKYHYMKVKRCREVDYELLTIFETDDMEKVKRLLTLKVGRGKRVYAKKCVVREIDARTASDFERKWHISGQVHAKVRLGLFDGEELISTMTFGKPRFDTEHQWEIVRYTVGEKTAVGGAGKLMKHFITRHNPESIVTYANLRFGEGRIYRRIGFRKTRDTRTNYFYCRGYVGPLLSRNGFQKALLKDKLEAFDPELSEWENMRQNGYDRIWDCGNAVFSWKRT